MHAGRHPFLLLHLVNLEHALAEVAVALAEPNWSVKWVISDRVARGERLTAISLVLAVGAVDFAVAHMLRAHALVLAAVDRVRAARLALGLVRLVQTIDVPVAPPVVRNAALLIAQEARAR